MSDDKKKLKKLERRLDEKIEEAKRERKILSLMDEKAIASAAFGITTALAWKAGLALSLFDPISMVAAGVGAVFYAATSFAKTSAKQKLADTISEVKKLDAKISKLNSVIALPASTEDEGS